MPGIFSTTRDEFTFNLRDLVRNLLPNRTLDDDEKIDAVIPRINLHDLLMKAAAAHPRSDRLVYGGPIKVPNVVTKDWLEDHYTSSRSCWTYMAILRCLTSDAPLAVPDQLDLPAEKAEKAEEAEKADDVQEAEQVQLKVDIRDGVTFTVSYGIISFSVQIREPYRIERAEWVRLLRGHACDLVFPEVHVSCDTCIVTFRMGAAIVQVPYINCHAAFNTCYLAKIWMTPIA